MYTNVGPFHLPRLQRGWQRIRPQEERREPKGRGWGPALALRMLPLLFSPVEVRRAPPLRPFLPSRSSPPFLEVALHGARTDARLIVHGVHGVRRAGQAEPPQATRGTAHGQTHGGQEARLRRPRVPRRPSRRLSRLVVFVSMGITQSIIAQLQTACVVVKRVTEPFDPTTHVGFTKLSMTTTVVGETYEASTSCISLLHANRTRILADLTNGAPVMVTAVPPETCPSGGKRRVMCGTGTCVYAYACCESKHTKQTRGRSGA